MHYSLEQNLNASACSQLNRRARSAEVIPTWCLEWRCLFCYLCAVIREAEMLFFWVLSIKLSESLKVSLTHIPDTKSQQ